MKPASLGNTNHDAEKVSESLDSLYLVATNKTSVLVKLRVIFSADSPVI